MHPSTSTAAALLLAFSAFKTAATAAATDTPRVNGWYPCAFSSDTHADKYGTTYDNMTVFECAEIEVPLCYDGVCNSDSLIDVFIKRRRAKTTKGDAAASKAVILIEGGPGYAAIGMEARIERLTELLDDSVDYYTIDHRGTGRSAFLQCDAAQALTAGSPDGKELSIDELQACLTDLNFQYEGQAAGFSTTSVAMDVRKMIELFMAEQDVFVAGFSYGTYVAQRILQLEIPQVVGYVFDGVDALSVQGDAIETANSHWNQGLVAPSRRLLEFCFDDEECPVTFESRETVLEDTLAFMDTLDKDATTNKCAQLLMDATGYEEPSVGLRTWMNDRVTSPSQRVDALKMLGMAQRCSDDDILDMEKMLEDNYTRADHASVPDELFDQSTLLYNVIVFSERWAQPAPTQDERNAFFRSSVFAMEGSSEALQYCVFTGSTESACKELQAELPKNDHETFYYKRDAYGRKPMVLPSHAGALILNGGLDFQTPREFGELLYGKLKGSGTGVMLVDFNYGVHCSGESVAESEERPCYDAVIAGFIQHNGDVTKVDTNCMVDLPTATFH